LSATEPIKEIRKTTEKIIGIVTDPTLKSPDKAAERNRLIRDAVDERFDWEEMARRTLARHWRKRSGEEKKEFVYFFGKFLERNYLEKVEGYSDVKVIYDSERIAGGYGIGKVRVVTSQGREIPVIYRLMEKGEEWYVYDVDIAGMSLINNYRSQFNSIIVRSSYSDLIKQLKARVEEDQDSVVKAPQDAIRHD
jgi:phospholipid transport system substrate-binding protein